MLITRRGPLGLGQEVPFLHSEPKTTTHTVLLRRTIDRLFAQLSERWLTRSRAKSVAIRSTIYPLFQMGTASPPSIQGEDDETERTRARGVGLGMRAEAAGA